MFMSLRTIHLADGQPATTAFIVDTNGDQHALSYASAMQLIKDSQPPIETPVEQLVIAIGHCCTVHSGERGRL